MGPESRKILRPLQDIQRALMDILGVLQGETGVRDAGILHHHTPTIDYQNHHDCRLLEQKTIWKF